MDSEIVQIEGFRDLMVALKTVNIELHEAVKVGLQKAGDLVAEEAKKRFIYSLGRRSGHIHTTEGFEARSRPTAGAAVFVGQKLPKTTGLRPDYGALQVTKGFLPARAAKIDEARDIVEDEVIGLLRANGF